MQFIEQVFCDAIKDVESVLWQCQLFTNTHSMNSILIYVVEVEKIPSRRNLFITTFYL